MRIISVTVNNYRNLDGLSVELHPRLNFLVGENNIGKSNFLWLLDTLIGMRRFEEEDFFDSSKPIEVRFSAQLDDLEIGTFNELCDPKDHNRINLVARQDGPGDPVDYLHAESGEFVPRAAIRATNFVYHDSVRRPTEELNFDRKRGVGKFLNYVVKKCVEGQGIAVSDVINSARLAAVLGAVNERLELLKPFRDFSVSASLEKDLESVVSRLFVLADSENRGLDSSGCGVQFVLSMVLDVLAEMIRIGPARLEDSILTEKDGTRTLPLILALDEPEVHLHPYMQRTIMRYFRSIVENNDQGFRDVLTALFSVGKVLGQVIIATHSPSILIGGPENVVRMYRDSAGKVRAVGGSSLKFGDDSLLHFARNMPYVKEAFFSKCVILGEGDTEMGALPVMYERVTKNHPDELGVSIIQPGGAGSIPKLMAVLRGFGINTVGILDRDYSTKVGSMPDLLFTDLEDFEEEVYEAFSLEDYVKYVEDIAPANRGFYAGCAKALGWQPDFRLSGYDQVKVLDGELKAKLKTALKNSCLKRMRDDKSVLNGQAIGESVTHVPGCYETLIKRAEELAKSC